MRLHFSKALVLVCAIALSVTTIVGCKSGAKDADIKAAIETALNSDATSGRTTVEVKDGIATLSGECSDEMCKAACEKTAAAIKGVKSVVNNCAVAGQPDETVTTAPVIVADDALTTSINTALKAFPGVNAKVKDGVVSLAGKINKLDRQKLMMVLQSLKAKKLDMTGLLNN